jgi:hypothetical protein
MDVLEPAPCGQRRRLWRCNVTLLNTSLTTSFAGLSSALSDLTQSHTRLYDQVEQGARLTISLKQTLDQIASIAARSRSSELLAVAPLLKTLQTQQAEMARLQMAMQTENRKFTSISNVLKTKHDAVKNSINNIR